MKYLFVPYELAVKLKEKGFSVSCFGGYSDTETLHIQRVVCQSDIKGFCLAPTYQQVTDWLRDKHFIYIYTSLDSYREPYKLVPQIQKMEITRTYVEFEKHYGHFDNTTKGNYEALNKVIEEALKLI